MSVRLGGSVISLNDVHLEKACLPISVRVGGSVITVKDTHPEKAFSPMLMRWAAA